MLVILITPSATEGGSVFETNIAYIPKSPLISCMEEFILVALPTVILIFQNFEYALASVVHMEGGQAQEPCTSTSSPSIIPRLAQDPITCAKYIW